MPGLDENASAIASPCQRPARWGRHRAGGGRGRGADAGRGASHAPAKRERELRRGRRPRGPRRPRARALARWARGVLHPRCPGRRSRGRPRHRGTLANHQRRTPRALTHNRQRLAAKTKLRTTIPQAARTLWTLSGPELYVLQTGHGDLSPDQYERWLGDLCVGGLLQPDTSHRPSPPRRNRNRGAFRSR